MRPKIDLETAEEIRRRIRAGATQKEITYETGLAKSTVSMIVANKIWKKEQSSDQPLRGM